MSLTREHGRVSANVAFEPLPSEAVDLEVNVPGSFELVVQSPAPAENRVGVQTVVLS